MTALNEVVVIEAGSARSNYWRDVLRYRGLLYTLAWRDVSVRYKQTIIGVAWALIRPLLVMVVFTVIFGALSKMPVEAPAPYALVVLCGLLPWTLFSGALAEASGSVVANASLITKVYFPRIIIPLAAIAVSLVDFLAGLLVLAFVMIWYQFVPSAQVFYLPLLIVMCILAIAGPALLMTALNVKYRDFRYIIPFAVQLGLYVSPVGFSSAAVPTEWRLLYSLNPMVGVIDGFRWAILGEGFRIYWPGFALSWLLIALFLWGGLRVFRQMERQFADVI